MREIAFRSRRRDAGFTLVELMVTVAIIAIMAGLAFSYTGERRANMRGFVGQFVSECDSARLRALSSRRWHRITFDTVERKLTVGQATTTGMDIPTDDDDWIMLHQIEIPPTVTVSAVGTSADIEGGNSPGEGEGLEEAMLFGPDGSAEPRTAYFSTTDGQTPMRVLIYRATGTAYTKEGW